MVANIKNLLRFKLKAKHLSNREDLLRLRRPLSKLIKDISEELELL